MTEHALDTADERCKVTYVLPVCEEADNIAVFREALVAATGTRADLDFEFISANDGSSDTSLDRLLELRRQDTRLTVLSLSRNFGPQIAAIR